MADYQRILSYLYHYEKAEKKECLGFVKAEQKSGNLKMTIQIDDERLLRGMELKLCFYEKQEEGWQVWQLDTLAAQEHKEEMHLTYPAAMLPTGFRIKGQSGVLLYYQDTFYYGSVWIGEEIPTEALEPLRWHKIVNSAKDVADKISEKQTKIEEVTGKLSEKQAEIEKVTDKPTEDQIEIKEAIPDRISEKQKVSARNIIDKMSQSQKGLVADISGGISEGQTKAEITHQMPAEQQEPVANISQKNVEKVALKKENILEETAQINAESFKKKGNIEKDFQRKADNKIENLKLEKNLSDSENDVAHSNDINIEESVKIKEFSADDIDSKNKSEIELKSELETDSKIELELEQEIDSEIEPKIKVKTEPEATSIVDNFEKMWINFMKEKSPVDNIFNTAFYEGYRILTEDLAQVGEEASVLKSNQFLLKGYERYHHILAGKVRYAGKQRYCIGVPGIYENREKYMAEIYQFPVFLSLTENRMKTGSFGYWLYLLRDRI